MRARHEPSRTATNFVAAILAAGASESFGTPKQLLDLDGRPLVRALAERALDASCRAVAVVVGAHAEQTSRALVGLPIDVLFDESWREGLASSIRTSVAWARQRHADALLLARCDQPSLTTLHLDRLIHAYQLSPGVVASRYAGLLDVPAVFSRTRFRELASLSGNEGTRIILHNTRILTVVDWADGAFDMDAR